MGDSDDEYDKKRRDKFRGERSSAGENYRSERRDDRSRGREDWPERGRPRPDYRDYRQPRERGYSPGREVPPVKRMRSDWEEGRPRYGGPKFPNHEGYGSYGWSHEHYPMHGGHGGFNHPPAPMHNREPMQNQSDTQTQPCMLTLKQFLASQDDSISDSDAITKYNEYKLEFKRQQLNEFFVAHKDEEWFKIKYHPEESTKRRDEQHNFLKRRVEVFSEVLDADLVSGVSVDTTQTDQLLRLLDIVVIKLEGGTEEDLKVLDEKPTPLAAAQAAQAAAATAAAIAAASVVISLSKPASGKDATATGTAAAVAADATMPETVGVAESTEVDLAQNTEDESKETEDEKKESNSDVDMKLSEQIENGKDPNDDDTEKEKSEQPKRKRSHSGSSSSSSSSSSSDDDEADEEKSEPANLSSEQIEEPAVADDKLPKPDEIEASEDKTDDNDESIPADDDVKMDEKNAEADSIKSPKNEDEHDDDEAKEMEEGEKDDDDDVKIDESTPTEPETIDLDKEKDPKEPIESGPRALHKTSSIFLRNLAPTITKAEVEAMCKRYAGYLRVAIADPLVERRWFRRGWVTLKRDVNIKDICWNLNNIRLRDCELGAIVNRDLSRRVRPVNGITTHRTIVRNDIKLCAKIAHNLDDKTGLWQENSSNGAPSSGATTKINAATIDLNNGQFGLLSNNPVLQNITDYLIEEASAEEDELLGLTSESKETNDGELIERDPQLLTVLDKIILYLRIVHSVDFYNHCEYPYEDEMPNRCGIIHARGPPPTAKVTFNEIQDYIRNFESKMSSFLSRSTPIAEDELDKLGCKDPEAEVEKFVQANTQELAKDKWLCPLSGKKFKGPEFIRKHIFNKHAEKVDEVRKEVEYFNNYLTDPKRPQLPEHPGNTKKLGISGMSMGGGMDGHPSAPGFRPGFPPGGFAPQYGYAPPMVHQRRGGGGGGGGGFNNRRGGGVRGQHGSGEYHSVMHYRDLDAPARDPDELL